MRLLRTNRDFRLLYAGTLISLGGDWFLTVALLDLVLQLTGSATLASLMLVCQTLPIFIVTPFAGHLIDRLDRRRVMIVVDVLRAFACLLPLLVRSAEMLPLAYFSVVLISVGSAFFEPASQAALPNIVAKDDLSAANVLMGSTWGTMLVVGAGLGGLVTAKLGRDTSFVVDAASFLLSAIILWRMRARFAETRDDHEHPPFIEATRQTLRYAWANPRVLALLTCKGGYGLGAGVGAMLGVFGKQVFAAGAFGIGLLYAARGLGALIGPFLVRGTFRRDESRYRAIAASLVLFGIGYSVLALSPSLTLGAIAIFVAHLGGGALWQISTYGLQREVPDRIRGRVFSADYGFVTLTMAISSIAAGLASDRFGPLAATIGTASMTLIFGIGWGVATWRLWR